MEEIVWTQVPHSSTLIKGTEPPSWKYVFYVVVVGKEYLRL